MNTIHIMKKSLYNHLSFIDESWVLYNAFTDEVSVLAPEVKDLYEKHDVEDIRKIHPDFYAYLQEKQFLVPENESESDKCIAQWDKEDNDPKTFSLTVNPTLNCNMSCWYCYEKHQVNRTMKEEISERVYKFIANKMADPLLKSFDLSFFGGEPLIQFKHIVKPLAEFAHQQAISNGKNFEVGFTTNGYLLFPKVLDFLSSLKVPVHFQITLDGNERMHNKTRHTANGTGSYFKILENCKNALTNPLFNVSLRCNYTTENVATFMDLAGDLEKTGIVPAKNLQINFHRVWQDHGSDKEVEKHIDKVYQTLVESGYNASDIHAQEKYRCYAEHNNHIVINYDGNLFHCTARDFTPEKSEGAINEEGTLQLNEKSLLRSKLKWGTEACMKCSIYPLCNGLCSQQKVEHNGATGCIAGYTQENKVAIIDKRVRYIINEGKKLPNINLK